MSILRIQHEGTTRGGFFYTPSVGSGHRPLIVVFHGGSGHVIAIRRQTRIHERALGCYVLYLNGTGSGTDYTWNAESVVPRGAAELAGVNDIGFVGKMLRKVKADHLIGDVYGVGLSKGGMMLYRLLYTDYFDKSVVVGGTRTCGEETEVKCRKLLHIHGTDDGVVPLTGDEEKGFPDVWEGLNEIRSSLGIPAFPNAPTLSADLKYNTYRAYCPHRPDREIQVKLVTDADHGWDWPTVFDTTAHTLEYLDVEDTGLWTEPAS